MEKNKKNLLDKLAPHFEKGGKYEKFYPIFEMIDTIMFTPASVTKGRCHIRDGLDQKRMMITVVVAMILPLLWGLYNVGYQANLLASSSSMEGWRFQTLSFFGLSISDGSVVDFMVYGALCFFPIFLVTLAVGGFCEVVFAIIRKHDITEGFLVTAFLIPLIMPPLVPLWQLALATAFGVVIGKEIFGGVGFNFLNPALTARAFLFFAYPSEMSGDMVWVAVDGVSKATPLGVIAYGGMDALFDAGYTLKDSFFGLIPGAIGESSKLFILIGGIILVMTKIGSARVMFTVILGSVLTALLLNSFSGFVDNPMFSVSPIWHLALGGLLFGAVYMATDPVSSAMTKTGKTIYGLLIGFFIILIRVVNPAYPEGVMLAILLMNVFAPVIDYYVVESNIKKRSRNYDRENNAS